MTSSALRVAVLASALACAAACSRQAPSHDSTPTIHLRTPSDRPAFVTVSGLPSTTMASLMRARLTPERWPAVLRVAIDDHSPPVVGAYAIDDDQISFTPTFPFEPGRQYEVRFDPTGAIDEDGRRAQPLTATVGVPKREIAPSTIVRMIYPSSDVLPENQLRMYIEFSAPMGLRSGIDYLTLLDEHGRDVPGPFLPLDYEFWNREHTRFTVFFDPGRVKQDILPNRQMGRPLKAGHTYTLVVRQDWRDANSAPLKEEYRRTFRVGAADTRPLDPSEWRIAPPHAGERTPLVVTFPEPIDHGLLFRALAVRSGGQVLDGDIAILSNETQWSFTPNEPWRSGSYDLLALSILEDRAGNQIGRAFEVDNFDTVDKGPEPKTVTLPFRVQ